MSLQAFGAAETMSDRFCVANNKTVRFSAEDIMTCCNTCGHGCGGGLISSAFEYWETSGVVSGGSYHTNEGCVSYKIPPCEHYISGDRTTCTDVNYTPKCITKCQSGSNLTYANDKHFAKKIYRVNDEASILTELTTHGPLEASFVVYEDFLQYKSGVYQYVMGKFLGSHAIKVLGYGVDAGVPYYLCANSWNYDWGNGGFFKIKRDNLFTEMFAGIPGSH